LQDLSDLLWAAAGINRPDSGKRTYSTAMNTQDADVYVLMKDGVYLYDYKNHVLNFVAEGDHRTAIGASLKRGDAGPPTGGAGQPGGAPGEAAKAGQGNAPGASAGGPPAGAVRKRLSTFAVNLVVVGEPSKCPAGSDELKQEWSAFSTGMIAQNVMLFCAANNMGTHPRSAFDKAVVKELLKLKDTQNPVIELPVGYLE
jgi:nitroreductase